MRYRCRVAYFTVKWKFIFFSYDTLEDKGNFFFVAVIELIIATIVNAIWIKQSFWLDVLLPITLIALGLGLELNALYNGQQLFFFTPALDYFNVNITYHSGNAGLASPIMLFINKIFDKGLFIFMIILISSLSFALVKLNFNAVISSIPIILRQNPDAILPSLTGSHLDLLLINSYLFVISIVGILVLNICFISMKVIENLDLYIAKIKDDRNSR